jgi:hypothetical protein
MEFYLVTNRYLYPDRYIKMIPKPLVTQVSDMAHSPLLFEDVGVGRWIAVKISDIFCTELFSSLKQPKFIHLNTYMIKFINISDYQ